MKLEKYIHFLPKGRGWHGSLGTTMVIVPKRKKKMFHKVPIGFKREKHLKDSSVLFQVQQKETSHIGLLSSVGVAAVNTNCSRGE